MSVKQFLKITEETRRDYKDLVETLISKKSSELTDKELKDILENKKNISNWIDGLLDSCSNTEQPRQALLLDTRAFYDKALRILNKTRDSYSWKWFSGYSFDTDYFEHYKNNTVFIIKKDEDFPYGRIAVAKLDSLTDVEYDNMITNEKDLVSYLKKNSLKLSESTSKKTVLGTVEDKVFDKKTGIENTATYTLFSEDNQLYIEYVEELHKDNAETVFVRPSKEAKITKAFKDNDLFSVADYFYVTSEEN